MALIKKMRFKATKDLGESLEGQVTFLDVDGNVVPDGGSQTGANTPLTGFTTGTAGAVAATDTVNQAIAKLQARIVALESA